MARVADPNRRNDILQAARAIFLERGYTGARISEIAERANVANGTVYLYFDSKEALVLALIEDFFARFIAAVLPALTNLNGVEAIASTVRASLAFTAKEGDLIRLVQLDIGLSTLSKQRPVPMRVQLCQMLAQVLEAKMNDGQIRRYDPQSLAELLAGLIEWVTLSSLLTRGSDQTHYEETLIRLLQHALLYNMPEEGDAP